MGLQGREVLGDDERCEAVKFPDRKTFDAAVAEANRYFKGSTFPSDTPFNITRDGEPYASFSDEKQRDKALTAYMVEGALRVVLEAQQQ